MEISKIKNVMVVGAGTMGHAIAQVYAQHGFNVFLIDLDQKKLDHAIKLIKSNLELLKEHNKLSKGMPSILNRIHISTKIEEVASKANLAIEAVNEVPEIKRRVFKQLDKYCTQDTILVSNTSGLNIFEITDVSNPERLVIHHWFCPAYIMPLVEIVPGTSTTSEIIDLSIELMKKLGKKPILLKEYVDNFIVNRIQRVVMVQTWEMLQKGWATPEQIDYALKTVLGVRLPVQGIVQSQDFTGLDLILDKQKEFRTNKRYPQVQELVEQGNLGVKSGKGFYNYGDRTELEVLRKRDELCLKMLDYLEQLRLFEPL
ncbi:MAG: 3-hydroxyacyl-CoA dehydrogenase family protein [Promethearchaeota archaeon]|jgi:3-hydroxyacyl-CoA dehydrogenase